MVGSISRAAHGTTRFSWQDPYLLLVYSLGPEPDSLSWLAVLAAHFSLIPLAIRSASALLKKPVISTKSESLALGVMAATILPSSSTTSGLSRFLTLDSAILSAASLVRLTWIMYFSSELLALSRLVSATSLFVRTAFLWRYAFLFVQDRSTPLPSVRPSVAFS